jgi:hypothetical protein
MRKCTGTIQKMGQQILEKGRDPEKCTDIVTKGAQQWKMYRYSFSLSTKTLAITTVFQYMRKPQPSAAVFLLKNIFFLFFSFLLSLFAPLNGIQQLEDTSVTHYQLFLPAFCALRAQFLCDTALPIWQFHLGTLALTTGSLRLKIGGNKFPPIQFIPF